MIRHGMLTIGVAVQAETFTNTPAQENITSTSISSPTTTSTSTASKSAIFLAPSKNGAPQTLRITFAYNKDTSLPEVIINLSEGDEEQYLKLKPLNETKRVNIIGDKDIPHNNSIDISKALQVYCFEKMESQSPSTTQVLEVQPESVATGDASLNPQKDSSSEVKNKGVKISNSHSNLDRTLDSSKVQVSQKKIERKDSNSENIKPSTISKVSSNVPNHNESSEKKSEQKEGDHSNKNEKTSPDKKTPSPKSNESSSTASKSSSKSNGRSMRKKSKSRVVIMEKGESTSPESPTRGITDRSKIPFINSAATGFMPCEYYRQKWLQENGCNDSATWNDYSYIQKTAGQKVINKMTAQQKKLEEEAVAQRKRTEFVFHEDLGSLDVSQNIIHIRRKQTRLEPLRTVPKCH